MERVRPEEALGFFVAAVLDHLLDPLCRVSVEEEMHGMLARPAPQPLNGHAPHFSEPVELVARVARVRQVPTSAAAQARHRDAVSSCMRAATHELTPMTRAYLRGLRELGQ